MDTIFIADSAFGGPRKFLKQKNKSMDFSRILMNSIQDKIYEEGIKMQSKKLILE